MIDRRSFLAALGGTAAVSPALRAQGAAAPPSARSGEWDLAWLDQFKGKHKQAFDLHSFNLGEDTPLRMVNNYLDTMRDVMHVEGADVNAVIGITRMAFPLNASDAIWQKYKLGERWKITDPATGQPSVRNLFTQPNRGGAAISTLQSRGVLFWQCNMALGGIVQELARATGQEPAAVRTDLVGGLLPGVKLVPAHTLLICLVQERGFTYEKE
jgi:hypothetical protein